MYGNAPRAMWEKWTPPDALNRIEFACRCLLARDVDGETVLLETGIGAFFEPKLRSRYGVLEDDHVLLRSLAARGVAPEDVDVVVLSHLHFDHAGGLLAAYEGGRPRRLLFPNARYVVGRRAWERARNPHPRDRASFIAALPTLLEQTGRLELVDGERAECLGDAFRFEYTDGHTPGLALAERRRRRRRRVLAADLIPGRPWVHLPITMGYDRYPELLIDEKSRFSTTRSRAACGCSSRTISSAPSRCAAAAGWRAVQYDDRTGDTRRR